MDVMTPQQRHETMKAIRSKDTKPEVFLAHLLWGHGFRYRKHTSRLPSHPDLHLAKYNTAVFINGCFWHSHDNCRFFRLPSSNVDFWKHKLDANRERDRRTKERLRALGVKQLVVWECTIKHMKKDEDYCEDILSAIIHFLQQSEVQYLEV